MGHNRPRDMKHERDRARRIVRREYTASLMSSAKWRALMKAVNDLDVAQMIIKFVESEREYTIGCFDLRPPYHYFDDYNGAMPILSIEWLEFPSVAVMFRPDNLPAKRIAQDLHAIKAGIAATGKQYRIEDTERGFRVIGHVR